jgi:rhamnose utilization protein RhaD (predicted bifunctional aldolase and dehydrogenase)
VTFADSFHIMYHDDEIDDRSSITGQLMELSREIGQAKNDWVAVAEGNVSARIHGADMLVKVTGARLASANEDDFVRVRTSELVTILDSNASSDMDVRMALKASVIDKEKRVPSVESLLHAVCLSTGGARFAAHTHPTAVNSFLCSDQSGALVYGSLFPDQIVVMGRHQLLVPYADPGLQLARTVRTEILRFVERHQALPRVIYLESHGMFALGRSAREVLDITEMTTKTARVLLGSMSVGRPRYLTPSDADRIDTRPDEISRRHVLGYSAR